MRNVKIWKIVKSSNLGFTLKFPKNIFWSRFSKKNGWTILGSFFGFFPVVNMGGFWKHRKMAIFWSNWHTHVWNSQFLGPLFVDLLDAKGHFSCFLKKVIVMGGNQKKVFFSLFFFLDQKNPKIYSFLPMRSTFWSFFGPKKMILFMTSGQNKSQNEKIWNLENCQILKS